VGVDLDEGGLAAVAAETGCETRVVDVTSAAANDELAADVVARHGRIDMAFLNAGVLDHEPGSPTNIAELDTSRYELLRAVNFDGVVHGVISVGRAMAANGGGSILATASVAGLVGYPPHPLYSATKAGVIGLVRAMAPSLAPDGVRINAICPGGVATPLVGLDPSVADIRDNILSPTALAAEMVATAQSDATGQAFSAIAGRDPVLQAHPFAPVPGFS